MRHPHRGKAFIFNHGSFDTSLSLKPRPGSTEDRDKLCKTLQDLHFEVKVRNDLTYDELRNELLGCK
jgi:hypothetical protein